jgi:hypothetical protein
MPIKPITVGVPIAKPIETKKKQQKTNANPPSLQKGLVFWIGSPCPLDC